MAMIKTILISTDFMVKYKSSWKINSTINCVDGEKIIISVWLTMIKIMAAKFESEIKSSSCKKHTSHILNNRKDAKIYAQDMCEYISLCDFQRQKSPWRQGLKYSKFAILLE